MNKARLAPYILVSFLIHAGVLIGVYQFLELPAEEAKSVEFIPVEMVVVREESPAAQPVLAPGDRIRPEKDLQTKSQEMMQTATDRSDDDMATPIPKAGDSEPTVTRAGMARPGIFTEALAGESAASKPRVPISQIPPSQISPVPPLAPIETNLKEINMSAVLVMAKAKPILVDFQGPQKLAIPFPVGRIAVKPVLEQPVLAVERHEEPRLELNSNAMLRDVSKTLQAETLVGKPMALASQMSPLQLSPADPSPPPKSLPLNVRLPAAPIEAKTATIPAYPRTALKVETPLASQPTRENLAAEHQPIPREGAFEPMLMVSTLQVQSQPNGAQVYVNGMLIGKTPLAWELPLGKHEVRLALPEYYDWDAQVELTPEHRTLPILSRLVPIAETK